MFDWLRRFKAYFHEWDFDDWYYRNHDESRHYLVMTEDGFRPMNWHERLRERCYRRLPRLCRFVWDEVCYRSRRLLCKVRGHDYEDHSTAGPNSGNIYIVCRRCGDSYYHSLY